MLLITSLFLVSLLFLLPCFSIALRKRPALKPDGIKTVLILLGFCMAAYILLNVFIIFVSMYGFSYAGVTFGARYSYAALALLLVVLGFLGSRWLAFYKSSSTSLALVGIDKEQAMPTLHETLEQMGLRYVESVSRLEFPDLKLGIEVLLGEHEIRFRTAQAVDKMFLRRLCGRYQEQYRLHGYPLPEKYLWFSAVKGGISLIAAVYLLGDYLLVKFFSA